MKTILGDKIEEYKIYDSFGEEIGKIKDIIVDTTKEKWTINDFIVSTGVIEKKAVCFDDINTINEEEKKITLKDNVEPHEFDEDEFSHSYISFDEIKKRDVYCENDEEIGNVYDYVIGTMDGFWEVQNILIKPKGDWLKGRRIRLMVDDVTEVKDKIRVKSTVEEVKEKCTEEE